MSVERRVPSSRYGGSSGSGTGSLLGEAIRSGAGMLRQAVSNAAREEMSQAREEVSQKLAPPARSAGTMAAGGLVAGVGATLLLQGTVQALSTVMPRWAALMLPGAALTAGGAVLIQRGRQQLQDESAPSKARSTQMETAGPPPGTPRGPVHRQAGP